mgnify:FL=1
MKDHEHSYIKKKIYQATEEFHRTTILAKCFWDTFENTQKKGL